MPRSLLLLLAISFLLVVATLTQAESIRNLSPDCFIVNPLLIMQLVVFLVSV